MTVRIIDTETTGVDPATCRVIEIASIDLTKTGYCNPQETFCALPDGHTIAPEIMAVTHIIPSDLGGAPPFEQAIESFKGANVYVAHNAKFDSSFLPMLGPWVCTYKCALRAWPDFTKHSNQAIRYALGLIEPFGVKRDQIAPHRALSDVIVTGAIFQELVRAGVTYSQMRQWTAEPCVFKRIGFGEHFGKPWGEVPEDYLHWIMSKDFDEDVRFNVQRELIARRENQNTALDDHQKELAI